MRLEEALERAREIIDENPENCVHIATRYTVWDQGDVIEVNSPTTPPGAGMWNVSGWEILPEMAEEAIRYIIATYQAPDWIRATIWDMWVGVPARRFRRRT